MGTQYSKYVENQWVVGQESPGYPVNGKSNIERMEAQYNSSSIAEVKKNAILSTDYLKKTLTRQPYTDEKGYELIGVFPWGRWMTLDQAKSTLRGDTKSASTSKLASAIKNRPEVAGNLLVNLLHVGTKNIEDAIKTRSSMTSGVKSYLKLSDIFYTAAFQSSEQESLSNYVSGDGAIVTLDSEYQLSSRDVYTEKLGGGSTNSSSVSSENTKLSYSISMSGSSLDKKLF